MASPARPRTKARTNRRRRFLAIATSSPSSSSTLIPPSTRLSTLRQEYHGDPVVVLNRLLNTLQENKVPGPQFFRLHKEFTKPLGEGGQGNVRGIDDISAKKYLKGDGRVASRWPVDRIAIKQYQRKTVSSLSDAANTNSHRAGSSSQHGLDARFRATEAEVLALSPSLFRGHPNIVQLMGWGLCLDTVENPKSPCCKSLQMPLLVLERAQMNLSQFISRLFSDIVSPEALTEEGFPRTESYAAYDSQSLMQGKILNTAWGLPLWAMGLETSPYALIQKLCLDIGHGLQALHEHKFTHGDLKPDNVLIFKRFNGWDAKLCDFGCARGEFNQQRNTNEDGKAAPVFKDQYLGTETWLPPKEEIASLHDFEGLRRCDIYVYGLVVWSAFCLRGRSPPRNPNLEDARRDLRTLGAKGGIFPFTRARFATRILSVLEQTMKDHKSRNDLVPWRYLASGRHDATSSHESSTTEDMTEDSIEDVTKDKMVGITWMFAFLTTLLRSIWHLFKLLFSLPQRPEARKFVARIQDPFNARHLMRNGAPVALSSAVKAEYNRQSWWQPESTTDQTGASNLFRAAIHSLTTVEPRQPSGHEVYGPASSTVLTSDDNSLSLDLFESERRRNDARRHPTKMLENIARLSRRPPRGSLSDLYYDARFRSRIRHEWWVQEMPWRNILAEALQIYPPVDIGTLAWLCYGVVGKYEVQNLPANESVWRNIISPNSDRTAIDESEKLDRFLLLLQFGARVERKLLTDVPLAKSQTIFATFVRNCRPATISIVLREIYRRFEDVKFKDHIRMSTRLYMTGNSSTTLSDYSSAKADINIEGVREVMQGNWYQDRTLHLPSEAEQSWVGRMLQKIVLYIKKTLYGDNFQDTIQSHTTRLCASEQAPLISIPRGWKASKTRSYFEEELSQSFTLTKPAISLIDKRQIEVGFLDKGPANVCHVDLTSCQPPQTDVVTIEALQSRFSPYDDDWFALEWTTETSRKDVLGAVGSPWAPLRTFAIRVAAPIYMAGVADWLNAIAAWTIMILVVGGIGFALGISFWQALKKLDEHFRHGFGQLI